ncbi:hypothetical protein EST38_g12940 [Candolleomyces aberdarensis]|uniref:Uncharacterized protein n=1 Tax=Candolleomyces aberdarensis TaxID=2316362 RepID=A0A4Q2D3I2_9AGAR|nr:hypothetical protein EST38_g12940 [Candolleomyces aberdarensis]
MLDARSNTAIRWRPTGEDFAQAIALADGSPSPVGRIPPHFFSKKSEAILEFAGRSLCLKPSA